MKKFTLGLLSIIVILGILAGCVSEDGGGPSEEKGSNGNSDNQSEASSENSNDEELSIAVVPKLVGIPYFNASETGAEKAGEELGVNVQYTGPTEADASQQVQEIENLIS